MRGVSLVIGLVVAAACAGPAPTGWLYGDVGGEPTEFVVLAGNWGKRSTNPILM